MYLFYHICIFYEESYQQLDIYLNTEIVYNYKGKSSRLITVGNSSSWDKEQSVHDVAMNYKRKKPARKLRNYYALNVWNFKKSFKRDYILKKEFLNK